MMQMSTTYTKNDLELFLSQVSQESREIRQQALSSSTNRDRGRGVLVCLEQIDRLVVLIRDNITNLTIPSSPTISGPQDAIREAAEDNIRTAQSQISRLLKHASKVCASQEPVSSATSFHLQSASLTQRNIPFAPEPWQVHTASSPNSTAHGLAVSDSAAAAANKELLFNRINTLQATFEDTRKKVEPYLTNGQIKYWFSFLELTVIGLSGCKNRLLSGSYGFEKLSQLSKEIGGLETTFKTCLEKLALNLPHTESSSNTSTHTTQSAISSPQINRDTYDQMGDDITCARHQEETITVEGEEEEAEESFPRPIASARVTAVAMEVSQEERAGMQQEIRTLNEIVQDLLRTTSRLAGRVAILEEQQARAVTTLPINAIPYSVTSPSPSVTSPHSEQSPLMFSDAAASATVPVSNYRSNNTPTKSKGRRR